jgi:hypothetical protein
MTLIGGLVMGLCIGFALGSWLMRERILEGLKNACSSPAFAEVIRAFERGDA